MYMHLVFLSQADVRDMLYVNASCILYSFIKTRCFHDNDIHCLVGLAGGGGGFKCVFFCTL